jgi:hypothetical protein
MHKSEILSSRYIFGNTLNDETLERIYIGRRFKNDTERLEKLFDLYTKMTANAPTAKMAKKAKGRTSFPLIAPEERG